MDRLAELTEMKRYGGKRTTRGLSNELILEFLDHDDNLRLAIDEAYAAHQELREEWGEHLQKDEAELARSLQEGIVNFYPADATNPYVPIASRGPWVITAYGAVIHDSGGYGMLGLGHAPDALLEVMQLPHVMANVMTPSFSHRRVIDRLQNEIGHSRPDGNHPFHSFIFMNSGSESVTVGMRIADLNAAKLTNPGAPHAGKEIRILSLRGGFHGRTDRPAQASNSTTEAYQVLATFRDRDNLTVVEHNDCDDLRRVFAEAEKNNVFFECMLMEPVQGEGNPGVALTREFYDLARELTRKTGTLLIVDSIQAAIRAQGCLSIVDYPGFDDCDPPDMETYSKALNGGQYPLSVLAMGEAVVEFYQTGIYGNTMTSNPKALEVACTVLDSITPELRENIRDRGQEFVTKLKELAEECPEDITAVHGTGLLFAAEINPEQFKVVGYGALEEYMRKNGIGVIHGGYNSLRFTPHFGTTSREVDLIVDALRQALENGPRLS